MSDWGALITTARHAPVWLKPIPEGLRAKAVAALDARDAMGFLIKASNVYSLALVDINCRLLQELGIYEEALLDAYIASRTNNHHYSLQLQRELFGMADLGRMRALGDPLPHAGPFILYRGVAGKGPARRVRGLSWTGDQSKAAWFADRGALWGLADPAVMVSQVPDQSVVAYSNDRAEDEYIVLLAPHARIRRLPSHAGNARPARF